MEQMIDNDTGLILENKKLAERLRRSDKLLLEANEELRRVTRRHAELMERMSHDLRSPLSVIIGFAELMLDEVPGKINEEQRRSLDDIFNGGKRLLNLISDLIDLYKLEPDRKD